MYYISPTKGRLTFEQMFRDIIGFTKEAPEENYKLIVGTDSQLREDICYVTAVIILREGKGGRFYYTRERDKKKLGLKQRIFMETARSLGVASRLTERLATAGLKDPNIEIHLDIGKQGRTKDIIREVVGMVVGSGFGARIKPESYGAFKVADRYTK
ncbi:MAG TPA: hypothetical protein GXZ26_02620 [Firmicutes bacterium]|jgi:predicted RNase H-related nuclease YkuK (DUF458 family)|nr:hypothetical protein [Bacillota bacterium]